MASTKVKRSEEVLPSDGETVLPAKVSLALGSEEFRRIALRLGAKGLLKSVYYSYKYTGQPDRLFTHPNVIVELSSDTEFSGQGYLGLGVSKPGVSHPRLKKSKFSMTRGASLTLPDIKYVATVGPGSVLHIEGDFSIGRSSLTADAKIICEESIDIGDGCAISWGVTILDSDRHTHYQNGEKNQSTAPVDIGDNVWIGHNSSIMKGVTINDGAIIASNSVVTEDVPAKTLAAGVPARPIAEDVNWEAD